MAKSGLVAILRYRSHSIIFRLMLLAIGLAAVGFISRTTLLQTILRDDVRALSAAHQLSIAEYVAHDINEKITLRLDLLARMAASMPRETLPQPTALQSWLTERQAIMPLFSDGMMVVSADGHSILANTAAPTDGSQIRDFSAADWFRDARNNGHAAIGKPTHAQGDGHPVLTMAVPIKDSLGVPVAVLAGTAALTSANFLNLLQDRKVGETGGFLLIAPRDGIFVAASDAAITLTALPPPGVNPLHDRVMAGFRGTGITKNATGIEELSAMAGVPVADWVVVARLPSEEAYLPVHHLQNFIMRSSAFVALAIIIVVTIILPRFFRPLTDAAQQLHGMANGEVEIKPLPVIREDEVGELAIGFNYLLDTLRKNEVALRESEARMAHLAHHDMLTGLANRAMFEDLLGHTLARAERGGADFAVLYLDLDGFKPINDTYGHDAGDEALREVSRRLIATLRKNDMVARIGGDEFGILLVDLEQPATDAALIAEKCRAAMALPIPFAGQSLTVGLSIGVACYPKDGTSADELLWRADQAMYCAKKGQARTAMGGVAESSDLPTIV